MINLLKEYVFLMGCSSQRLCLHSQLITLLREQQFLPVHLKKYIGFAAHDVRLYRLLYEVDSPSLIAPKATLPSTTGCHKYNWDVSGSIIAPHQFCKLKAVEPWHLNIHKSQRNVVLQEQLQRLISRFCFQQLKPFASKQSLKRNEIFLKIVYEKKRYRVHNLTQTSLK